MIDELINKFFVKMNYFRERLRLSSVERLSAKSDERFEILNRQFECVNKKLDRLILFEAEQNYCEIFHDAITNADWLKDRTFVLTKSAANYSFMFLLFEILNRIKPQNILELGLGQTSKLSSQYVMYENQSCELQILEHNQDWINDFSQQLPKSDNIKIIQKNLIEFEINGSISDKYDDISDVTENKKFDLIIIDGPFGFHRKYPRTNILDLIPYNLNDDFVIIFDDLNREGEKNTAELIFEKLEKNNIEFSKSYKTGLKTQLVITSPKFEGLHWL